MSPVSCQNEYASEVQQLLSNAGIYADVDNGPETFKKKIRNGEVAQYNFLLGEFLVHFHPVCVNPTTKSPTQSSARTSKAHGPLTSATAMTLARKRARLRSRWTTYSRGLSSLRRSDVSRTELNDCHIYAQFLHMPRNGLKCRRRNSSVPFSGLIV